MPPYFPVPCLRVLGLAFAALLVAGGGVARAETTFRVEPVLYLPRLIGDVQIDGTGGPGTFTTVDDGLGLGDLEASPGLTVEADFRNGWGVVATGFMFSTEAKETYDRASSVRLGDLTLRRGDAYRIDWDEWSAGLEVRGPVLLSNHTFLESPPAGDPLLTIRPVLGVRYVDIDVDVRIEGAGRLETGGSWVMPQAGGLLTLWRRFREPWLGVVTAVYGEATLTAGPAFSDATGWGAHIRTGVRVTLWERVGVQFGYQLVHVNASDDEFDREGGPQGLFLGASIEF